MGTVIDGCRVRARARGVRPCLVPKRAADVYVLCTHRRVRACWQTRTPLKHMKLLHNMLYCGVENLFERWRVRASDASLSVCEIRIADF